MLRCVVLLRFYLKARLQVWLVWSGSLVVVVVIYNNNFFHDVWFYLNSTWKPGTKCGWYEVVLVGVFVTDDNIFCYNVCIFLNSTSNPHEVWLVWSGASRSLVAATHAPHYRLVPQPMSGMINIIIVVITHITQHQHRLVRTFSSV